MSFVLLFNEAPEESFRYDDNQDSKTFYEITQSNQSLKTQAGDHNDKENQFKVLLHQIAYKLKIENFLLFRAKCDSF